MLESEYDLEWTVQDRISPDKLAQKIRGGISASKRFESYRKYGNLLDTYTLKVIDGSKLIAQHKDKPITADVNEIITQLTLPEYSDALSIIQAVIKFKHQRLVFPHADVDERTLTMIYNYATQSGYSLVLAPDTGIILIKGELESRWVP